MLSPTVFKAFRTANVMLKKRNYTNDYEYDENLTYEKFLNERETLEQLTIKATHNLTSKKIVVYFPEVETKGGGDSDKSGHIGIKQIRGYIDKSVNEKIYNIILIVENSATMFAQKELKDVKVEIEIFSYANLQIDITTHVLVPKHRLLSEEEKREVMKEYTPDPSKFPQISVDDPASKFYGFRKHEMIEITRFSETAGISVSYRIVV